MNKNILYRSIPKVDILLADAEIQGLIETYSRDTVMESIHMEMDKLRNISEHARMKKKQNNRLRI